METQILKLELTVAEINVILRSLGKHPFDEIADLISKIRGQGETQLEQMLDEREKACKHKQIPLGVGMTKT